MLSHCYDNTLASQVHYTENFVWSILQCAVKEGDTLVVGGDGRWVVCSLDLTSFEQVDAFISYQNVLK